MNKLEIKKIKDLLGKKFSIPAYQRGYRWTERQATDLLNDILDFKSKNESNGNWYCLQPVVVKERESHFEIIDGQQRLTTIFLILKYLEHSEAYEIAYETREKSARFLKEIGDDQNNQSGENIDYYHISKVYRAIKEWFKTKGREEEFKEFFLARTKVIWYEVPSDKDSIEIFTRINMGKIPLTNAELIKALFLNSSNFKQSDSEELMLTQLEIASEWDRIEYHLQDDKFWYFINESENNFPTRIEYLFEIIQKMENKGNHQSKKDPYSTFRFFSEKFGLKNGEDNQGITDIWRSIKRIFQTIEEWYSDRELYHKTGFLITTGQEIHVLLKKSKDKSKIVFREYLNKEIRDKVPEGNLKLKYGKGNGKIKHVLLLHNIQTMLSYEKASSRFPFDRYKEEKWDIEHIHATATKVNIKKLADLKEWLKNNFIESDQHKDSFINNQIKKIIDGNIDDVNIPEEDFQKIIDYVLGEPDNRLRNLCLLDSGTNRSYGSASFNFKRTEIIRREKEEGTFIPICTRNLFMKYYSNKVKGLELWNEDDRVNYLKNIGETIKKI